MIDRLSGALTEEFERSVTLDHITRAFKIELAGTPVWSVTAHGYLHLPDLELTGSQSVSFE